MPWNVAQAVVLFGSALLAIWVGATAFERQSVPGRTWLGWLQFAIAFWCLTSGLHALIADTSQRIVVSQLQYFGIMALPACWLEFARGYTRRPPSPLPWLVWVIPATTVGLALSNGSHHLLWREIRELPARRALAARSGERIATLEVGGMTCASCVARVEKALNKVPGVTSGE